MNNFEQVPGDHHYMSLVRVSPGLMSGEGYPTWPFQQGIPCHVTHPLMHLMLPTPPPPCGETDACENIAFPQLLLWTVIMQRVLECLLVEACFSCLQIRVCTTDQTYVMLWEPAAVDNTVPGVNSTWRLIWMIEVPKPIQSQQMIPVRAHHSVFILYHKV